MSGFASLSSFGQAAVSPGHHKMRKREPPTVVPPARPDIVGRFRMPAPAAPMPRADLLTRTSAAPSGPFPGVVPFERPLPFVLVPFAPASDAWWAEEPPARQLVSGPFSPNVLTA